MGISDWSSDVCSSDPFVAEKLRYLQPAQIILSWSIRILLVWLILVAATMALVPAKGPSWTVPLTAVENVRSTPASSPAAPQAEAHDDSAEKRRCTPAANRRWSSSILTLPCGNPQQSTRTRSTSEERRVG